MEAQWADFRPSRQSWQRLGIVDRLDRRLGSVVSTESRHSGHRLGGSFGSIGHTRLSRHAGELYNFCALSMQSFYVLRSKAAAFCSSALRFDFVFAFAFIDWRRVSSSNGSGTARRDLPRACLIVCVCVCVCALPRISGQRWC